MQGHLVNAHKLLDQGISEQSGQRQHTFSAVNGVHTLPTWQKSSFAVVKYNLPILITW